MMDLSRRQCQLLMEMLSNQGYRTVKYYSDLLNVSQRTIHNDLKRMGIIVVARFKRRIIYGCFY